MTILIASLAEAVAGQTAEAPTPLSAIRTMNNAFVRNDPSILANANAPVTPDELEFVSAEKALLTARGKINAAYLAKFPESDKGSLPLSIISGPALSEMRIAAAVITAIDDRTAVVTIPGGTHYTVALIDGRWRIQVARSIASVYPSDSAKALRGLAAMFRGVATTYDSVTEQIQTGALATPDAVAADLKGRLASVYKASDAALPPRAWIDLPNAGFIEQQKSPGFTVNLDPNIKHYDQPAMKLASTDAKPTDSGNAARPIDVAPYRGKRVRFSAYLKSKDVANWGGIGLVAMADTGKWLVFDTLSNEGFNTDGAVSRVISGTTDWKQFECVADIPIDASRFMAGMQLYGSGQLWIDDAKIEIVGQDVPTTDDQNIHLSSVEITKYAAFFDPAHLHDGEAGLCIVSNTAPKGAFSLYGWTDRHPEQYLDHRIRLSAWIKAENAVDGANLKIFVARPKVPDRQIDNQAGQRPIKGTVDWNLYEVVADIPADAQCVMPGLNFWGNGKLWVQNLKVEIIDAPKSNR